MCKNVGLATPFRTVQCGKVRAHPPWLGINSGITPAAPPRLTGPSALQVFFSIVNPPKSHDGRALCQPLSVVLNLPKKDIYIKRQKK